MFDDQRLNELESYCNSQFIPSNVHLIPMNNPFQGALRNMMVPFVVPERVTGAEPPPIMRFVLKSETRFQPLGLK